MERKEKKFFQTFTMPNEKETFFGVKPEALLLAELTRLQSMRTKVMQNLIFQLIQQPNPKGRFRDNEVKILCL